MAQPENKGAWVSFTYITSNFPAAIFHVVGPNLAPLRRKHCTTGILRQLIARSNGRIPSKSACSISAPRSINNCIRKKHNTVTYKLDTLDLIRSNDIHLSPSHLQTGLRSLPNQPQNMSIHAEAIEPHYQFLQINRHFKLYHILSPIPRSPNL